MLFSVAVQATTFRRVIDRVTSLDPIDASSVHASRCDALIYETLLEYSYEQRPYTLVPSIATAMPEISDDGCIYTFTINTNIFFTADISFGVDQNGAPRSRNVVADDVIYSFKRLADAKLAAPGLWTVKGRIKGIDKFWEASSLSDKTDYSISVEGLRSPAPDKLIIELTQPSPVFLWTLAMPYMSVVPHEAVTMYGEKFSEHPVGTGPYTLDKWRRNYSMRFKRNHAWRGWKDNPSPFEVIYFPLIDDPSTQWLSFLAGELDLQGEISRDNWEDVLGDNGELNPFFAGLGMTMSRMSTLEVSYIGINMSDPILGKNKKLRQALNAAFDAARWESYYRGRIRILPTPVPSGVEGSITNDLPYGRGIETAKRLLAEAGYPDGQDPATGKPLQLTIDIGRTTQDFRESTELMIAFMDRCGIKLIAEYSNWPTFLKKVSEERSQLFRISWVGDYPDAENFLQLFYSRNSPPGPNRAGYKNPYYDELFERAMAAPHDERIKLYEEMQRIIQEDSPWIFIGTTTSLSLSSRRLRNYHPHDFPYGMEKHYRNEK